MANRFRFFPSQRTNFDRFCSGCEPYSSLRICCTRKICCCLILDYENPIHPVFLTNWCRPSFEKELQKRDRLDSYCAIDHKLYTYIASTLVDALANIRIINLLYDNHNCFSSYYEIFFHNYYRFCVTNADLRFILWVGCGRGGELRCLLQL